MADASEHREGGVCVGGGGGGGGVTDNLSGYDVMLARNIFKN